MIANPSPIRILVCQPPPRSSSLSLCGLTEVGLQLQKREAVQPEPCPAQNKSGGYLSGEEVLTDTSSTGHGFTAILGELQPSQTPGAATPPGFSPLGKKPSLPSQGTSNPLTQAKLSWSEVQLRGQAPRCCCPHLKRATGFSRARAGNHRSLFLAGTQGRMASAARLGECQTGQRFWNVSG